LIATLSAAANPFSALAFPPGMIDAGRKKMNIGREGMSRALAVFHGRFGRATVYQLNRPFNMHAHREGHLIFHVGGTPARIDVCEDRWLLAEDSMVAINPWEPHNFVPTDMDNGAIFFVLYVNAEWFAPDAARTHGLRFGKTCFKRTATLDKHIRRTAALVCGAPSLASLDGELRQLIDGCYEESWQAAERAREIRAAAAVTDFRVRKSIKLMSESPGAELELDLIARESGLSRPHFYRLFRTQTGVTPHLYLNTLIMEQALDALVASEAPIADIGFDLGFSSQSGFTRFFAANVGMAPTEYRRAAKVLRA
jgi:AraC-like DNA-binding protein